MAYSALTIGLADDLLTDLQMRIKKHDLFCSICTSVQEAGRLLNNEVFHLLIVDLEYLRSIRQIDWLAGIRHISFAPVIVLSDTPVEDVRGMVHLGADICISGKRPYSVIADLAYAQLRRYTEYNHYRNPAHAEIAPFRMGDIYIDPARRLVEVCGQPVSLRRREFSLLLYFMQNPNIVLTPERICAHAWRMKYTQSVGQSIHDLRKGIEPNPNQPRYIQTVHRVGYRFVSHPVETCGR